MLTLVLADNFLLLYVAWELVGIGSYLLIGFWHERPAAREAAKKAFIVTRIGDVGLLVGILLIWREVGSFSMSEAFEAVRLGVATDGAQGMSQGVTTAAALLLFLGAMGKSAQVPFHVWLPDAMEGPDAGQRPDSCRYDGGRGGLPGGQGLSHFPSVRRRPPSSGGYHRPHHGFDGFNHRSGIDGT